MHEDVEKIGDIWMERSDYKPNEPFSNENLDTILEEQLFSFENDRVKLIFSYYVWKYVKWNLRVVKGKVIPTIEKIDSVYRLRDIQ